MNTYENYKDLANAIVMQAVCDYEDALAILSTEFIGKTKKINDKILLSKQMKYDCESFFTGDHIQGLTNISGRAIMNHIKKGVLNADRAVYNEKRKGYVCKCDKKLKPGCGRGFRMPVIRCSVCSKYWRMYGHTKPIE